MGALLLALLGFAGYQRMARRRSDAVADEEAVGLSEKQLAALEAGTLGAASKGADNTFSFGGDWMEALTSFLENAPPCILGMESHPCLHSLFSFRG